jgi:hypothetical protein
MSAFGYSQTNLTTFQRVSFASECRNGSAADLAGLPKPTLDDRFSL